MNNANFNRFMKSNQISEADLKIKIQEAIVDATEKGYFVFLNSCMTNFEILAGIALFEIKQELQLDILMICSYPYSDYLFAGYVSSKYLLSAEVLIKKADISFALFDKYRVQCRNIYLLLLNTRNIVICFNTANSRNFKQAIGLTEYQKNIYLDIEGAGNEKGST